MNVKILPAHNGDCLLISFEAEGKVRNILVDGGIGRTGLLLMQELKAIEAKGQLIDLLIVTHIDDDHIGGIIKVFSKKDATVGIIKKVWFNSGSALNSFFKTSHTEEREVQLVDGERVDMSIKQGNTLEKQLRALGIWDECVMHTATPRENLFGATIHILSPSIANLGELNKKWETETNKPENVSSAKRDYNQTIENLFRRPLPVEDSAVPNGSSIAVMIEYNGLRSIYLADAHPTTVEKALENLGYSESKPLAVNLVKIAHHGSSYNISERLLRMWSCKNYVVSTNGAKHGLPNKLCLAKLIVSSKPGANIYFNYKEVREEVFLKEDYINFDFQAIDLSEKTADYTIEIKENGNR